VSSPQLLLNQAPISVLLLAFLVPWCDTMPDVSKIPRETVWALGMSGLAAASLVGPSPIFMAEASWDEVEMRLNCSCGREC
jgi:hypothetical protein